MSAYYNEFDHRAAAWLRELIKRGLIADGEVDERSIVDVAPDDLRGFTQCHFFAGIGGWSYALRLSGWPDDRPVWTGSAPCQPFSSAGQQKGKDDVRHLAPKFAALVRACRPPMLFGEQVASADVFGPVAKGSGRGSSGTPQWAWLDDLSDRLEAAHYAVGASDIPAAGVGAPHIRQRTFFGAIRLADTASCGCEPRAGHGGLCVPHACEGPAAQQLGPSRSFVGLADTQRGERGSCGLRGFRQADGAESAGATTEFARGRDGRGLADTGRPSTDHGGWGSADWLFCRDGKWRSVEPSAFPLAYGLPARVGRLRGYGNAIVPQAAAEFVKAFVGVLR